jgi:elongation factor G
VLCGSSFKHKGVQPLLDSIINFLPSPIDLNSKMNVLDENEKMIEMDMGDKGTLCALAFKVINDKNLGILVFLKVYSGKLFKNDPLKNQNKNKKEKITKLLQMSANEPNEIGFISFGNIGTFFKNK